MDPRKALREQEFLDQRIEGAKTLQYVSDHNTMYADQPKAHWQWDGVKEDYVDVNKRTQSQLRNLKHWGRNKLIERSEKETANSNLVRKIK